MRWSLVTCGLREQADENTSMSRIHIFGINSLTESREIDLNIAVEWWRMKWCLRHVTVSVSIDALTLMIINHWRHTQQTSSATHIV
jgi:hypothetical protein